MEGLRYLALCFVIGLPHVSSKYDWREKYYKGMPIDPSSKSSKTFDLRYLINDASWKANGPIFFHTSNEGSAEEFAEATGLMWDWAKEFGAMLVFPDHRYYGKSLPYGKDSNKTSNMKDLTVDQAMEDYATLLNSIKKTTPGAASSPVIAFGGSYGAMLAAWMRLKYPDLIKGAVASSAPIRQLIGGDASCTAFGQAATNTYAKTSQKCVDAILKSWPILETRLKTDQSRLALDKIFNVCPVAHLRDENAKYFLYTISNAYLYMAMYDYPYPTKFLESLPAWPVKEACKYLTANAKDDDALLSNVNKAMSIFYNYEGKVPCLQFKGKPSANNHGQMWQYQMCTELAFQLCYDEKDILMPDKPWSEKTWFADCQESFSGSKSRSDYITKKYGVEKLKSAKNIIFTNGDLDPWSNSGITKDQLKGADPSLVAINIPNAAHHYDLRPSHPSDTKEVIEARKQMKTIVSGWLGQGGSQQASKKGKSG